MTTSRELVYQTLEFRNPERIPRQIWRLPWAREKNPERYEQIIEKFPEDIQGTPGYQTEPSRERGEAYAIGSYVDPWGCMFENVQRGVIGEVKEPLLKDWKDWRKVIPPYDQLSIQPAKINEYCAGSELFMHGGCCPRPFEQLQFIRGSENLLMDLALLPDELFRLLEVMQAFYRDSMTAWAETDVDGLTFMDDWGSQRDLLISPDTWRKVFKPCYKEYIDIAHSHGKKCFMHSDGHTLKIYDDLVELGLDAFNSQIFAIGVENLEKYAGKITFWGEIDRQYLLNRGTVEENIKAVELVYKTLYRNGGVIAQCEFGVGSEPDNVEAVFERWNSIHPPKV